MKVHSIFESINGEVTAAYQGSICTFVRLAGCNLRCSWCDTPFAADIWSGYDMSKEEIFQEIVKIGNRNITITGGEPLSQKKELIELIDYINEKDSGVYKIAIETNGAFNVEKVIDRQVFCIVMDYKLPSSGMEKFMNLNNFNALENPDFVKFVIADRKDFDRAIEISSQIKKSGFIGRFAFSPCHGNIEVPELFKWLKEAQFDEAIINLQLHKIIDMP
ncbi:MAG: radical SAM protein [Syntrophorhabdaceae bacterium]|nr:radical SAM protein [Syntrophorhabdaceae bacterium]